MNSQTEPETALRLASTILDNRHLDPDSDICVLARQLIRTRESLKAYQVTAKRSTALLFSGAFLGGCGVVGFIAAIVTALAFLRHFHGG